jgi:hypothetical protein
MRRNVKVLWLALLLLVISAATYFIWHNYLSSTAKVMDQVRGALNDPDSAKFQNVEFFPKTGAGCGLVNAKNKMGGYVGSTRFVALANGEVHFAPQGDTVSGSPESRIKAIQEKLDYLNLDIANCPDK